MTVSTDTARTVVRDANTACVQVTVTTTAENATGTHAMTGTARFTDPGDPICYTLMLFNVALPDRVAPCIMVRLTDLTAIELASADADSTLGTVVTAKGTAATDHTWTFGTGTE